MKFKNTIILLVLAVGVFLFVHFYEGPPKQWTDYLNTHVAVFNPETIDGISITNNEGKIDLHKMESGEWEVVSPVKDRADLVLVNKLLTDLVELKVDDAFEADGKTAGNPSLKEIGLETSNVRLKLSGKDAPPEILFGKDTPVTGKMYVRLEGSNTVRVAGNALKGVIQGKADDFRDHKLINFTTAQVSAVDIKSTAGEIELLKDRGEWSLNKPIKARGDAQRIPDLIAQTINMHIDAFLPDTGANLATLGLAEPRGTITFNIEGNDKPAVLQVGLPVENAPGKVYAKLSSRESIYVLPQQIEAILNLKPNELRDKHLLKLNFDVVDRFHIVPANKPKLTFVRQEENWKLKTSGDIAANATLVKNFVTFLQNQKVVAFVADVASDLPKYGLDKPQMKVIFSSYASENTSETTAGEVPFLTLAFGKAEGNIIYARVEEEPYVVSIPKQVFDSIPTEPVLWQATSIFNFKPEEIASIEIVRDSQPIGLERAKNGWKLTKGNGVLNQTSLQSLLNTLSTLRAVDWTGTSTKGLGFEKPTVVISFTTYGKKTGKLTIGSVNENSMWNAESEGSTGTFLVNKPDYDALHTDVMATDKPSPAPLPAVPAGAAAPSGAPAGVQ